MNKLNFKILQTKKENLSQTYLRLLMVLMVLPMAFVNAWAGSDYNTALRAFVVPEDTGKGLVYAKYSDNTATPVYTNVSKTENFQPGEESKWGDFYAWAQPARGYKFNSWALFDFVTVAGYDTDGKGSIETIKDGERRGQEVYTTSSIKVNANTGTADHIQVKSWGGGAGDDVCGTVQAVWVGETAYIVNYKQPVGGNYNVEYKYSKVENNAFTDATENLILTPTSGDKRPYGLTEEDHEDGYSYITDKVTLSTSAENFLGWYENGEQIGGPETKSGLLYSITKEATVEARFRWVELTGPKAKTVIANSNNEAVEYNVVLKADVTGSWGQENFGAELQNANGTGTFVLGGLVYSGEDGTLTVNFTYNANGHWEETSSVDIALSSTYGDGAIVKIYAIAEAESSYEARVFGEGIETRTGTLADMLDYANTLDDKPTLQLKQDKVLTSTLRFQKSMTFDLNSHKLSSTTLNNLILVQGTNSEDKVALTITDNSYAKLGEIEVKKGADAVVEAVKVADANKLTLAFVSVSAENTEEYASNTNAKAYGVHIDGTGNVIISKKANAGEPDVRISVKSDHDARGVYAEGGYATFQNVAITAEANVDAYAFHSNATSNISDAELTATTTDGANAYAAFINGGKAVIDRVHMTATSATTAAYGANVAAGTLIANGGSVTAKATSDVYGVCVQSGATANIQVKTNIEATSTTGANAYGVQNLGTVTLNNIAVTATSATNYATAVNTETSAVSTTIEDGTYTATSATGYAYGLHHQYGDLNIDGGTFSAKVKANNAYGVQADADAEITNATIMGEVNGTGSTYGFCGGATEKNISLIHCTVKAKSSTSTVYAIHNIANLTVTNCALEARTPRGADTWGVYAAGGACTLNTTNTSVISYTTGACGIEHKDGSLLVNGGVFDVTARQEMATAGTNSGAYGAKIADGKTASLSNAKFIVKAPKTTFGQIAYGAYTGSGTIISNNCSYEVSTVSKAYGIWGDASSTLTLQNNTIVATATGSTTAYGVYSNGAFTIAGDDVTSSTKKYASYSMNFGTSAHGTISGGKFMAEGYSNASDQIIAPINKVSTPSNIAITGGYFFDIPYVQYYLPNGYKIYGVDPDAPEYAEKYYYVVDDHMPYENVCYITEVSTGFPTLAEAFDYARNHSDQICNILMTQPYTLPAGNYSIPANATLVVPYKGSQTMAQASSQKTHRQARMIAENRLLTLATGVNIDVYGSIEPSAELFIDAAGKIGYVQGSYGRIHMESGSTITLNSGANIYAYGYITGEGEIRVKNGATVYEDFQTMDMKGAKDLNEKWIDNEYKTFPLNQYYVQNIEVPTKYYYGAQLLGKYGYIAANMEVGISDFKLIGTDDTYFFFVETDDESRWVRKRYDKTTDRIIWETNSSASLGSLKINISGYSFDSKDYILPLTNNMTIHALTGLFTITQSTVMLPGSEIIIDKTSTLQINKEDTKSEAMGLYLYDKSQWSTAAIPIVYSPSWSNGVCPRSTAVSSMDDASIYVKGKIDVGGALCTTAGGAAIYSDNTNAGTIEFNANAAADGTIYKTYKSDTSVPVTSAKLRNGGKTGPDANMTITKGEAAEGDTYAYTNISGTYQWTKLVTIDECIIANMTEQENPVYYAKPQGYVAITSDIEDANHLFYSVEGEGDAKRKFIKIPTEAGCQWWEVTTTLTDGVYYCATNGTYYHWVPDMVQVEPGVWEDQGSWEEYKVNVTFYFTDPKSEDANKKKVLEVNYGAKPDASIVSNPSKTEDAAATYQFYGWKSSNTGNEYSYTAELESVTEDMYYLPVFTSITKKYTVTFKDAKNGVDVPIEVFYDEHPSYSPVKDATAQYTYYFQYWLASDETTQYAIHDELPAVTGTASYTAVWAQVLNRYTIIWKNGDEILETDIKQAFGAQVSYDGVAPTKETGANFVYTFDGWSLTEGGAKLASLPTVNGEMTFYAHYSTTPRYAVTFANYDGAVLQKESVTAGERPIYNGLTPGRVRDLDGYFKFIGWKNSEGEDFEPGDELPIVTGKETYTAQYDYVTELYTITLNNVDGNGASWSGKFGVGATPFYNKENDDVAVEPTKVETEANTYTFDYWFDGEGNHYALNSLPEVTGTATYTAHFDEQIRKYNITFANLDGNGASREVTVEYGQTPACPVDPAKGDNYYTYDFTGWTPAIAYVAGDATYTATFSATGTPRTFPITFDPDNGVDAPYVLDVAYGQTPNPTDPEKATDEANTYTFSGWSPALEAVTGPAEYTAQYTPTVRKYTITFVNYDGSTLKTTTLPYGATPTANAPVKPLDMEGRKAYTFTGWKNTSDEVYAKDATLPSVGKTETYTAQFSEINFVASVTPEGGVPDYKSSWTEALNAANNSDNCTLKLYNDVTLGNSSTEIKANMTIDLNGYTIIGSSSTLFYQRSVALTIDDSQGGGMISHVVNSNNTSYTIDIRGDVPLTINAGVIHANKTTGSRQISAFRLYNDGILNLNGGEVIVTNVDGKAAAIYHDGAWYYGYSNITGGKIKATTIIDYSSAERDKISGGYFSTHPGNDADLLDGKKVCVVPDSDPLKAEGYNFKVAPGFAITWKNDDESTIKTENWETGTTPVYEGEIPTKQADGRIYEFAGTWSPALAVVDADATYTAQFNVIGIDATTSGEDEVVIDSDLSVTTTTVETTGALKINSDVTLTTENLILESTTNVSGEIVGAPRLNVTGHAYFDVQFNGEAGTAHRTWYAIAVPWEVDAENGILWKEGNRKLVLGRDFDLVWYDGEERAANGDGFACWKYVEYQDDKKMHPGKAYMMYFGSQFKTVRFEKNAGAPIIYTNDENAVTSVVTYDLGTGDAKDGNWNGIANPAVYHATLGAGESLAQVLGNGSLDAYFEDPTAPVYTTVDMSDYEFVVGKPVFVQASSSQPIVVASVIDNAALAPHRARTKNLPDGIDVRYAVHIALESHAASDNLFVQATDEEKAETYVIGKDLAKGGVAKTIPQLWVNRYDSKLSANTQTFINDIAEYPLSLYAPNNGEYVINTDNSFEDYDLYLMQNGNVIWNLSNSAYTLSLPQGNTTGYGLRIIKSDAPQTATGMDEAVVDANGETMKVIINDQVFIIRGNQVYSIDGQLVK